MNKSVLQNIKIIISFLIDAEALKKLSDADAIFIFGHIDRRVGEHASFLFAQGKAKRIAVTGKGRMGRMPIGFTSEMEYITSVLCDNGVPQSAIVGESKATNTLENVLFGMEAFHSIGFYPESLILCANPLLLRRSHATFQKQFPEILTHGSAYCLSDEEWQVSRIVQRILGEVIRLQEYAQKGDTAFVAIPENVKKAFGFVSKFYRPI